MVKPGYRSNAHPLPIPSECRMTSPGSRAAKGYSNSLMRWVACPAVPFCDTIRRGAEPEIRTPTMLPRPANTIAPLATSTRATATAAPRVDRKPLWIAWMMAAGGSNVYFMKMRTA